MLSIDYGSESLDHCVGTQKSVYRMMFVPRVNEGHDVNLCCVL